MIADSAPSIHNGFKLAYQTLDKRINCWAHVIRNVDDELSKVKCSDTRIRMRQDICNIQLSFTKKIFDKLASLFCSKWQKINANNSTFISGFYNDWCLNKNGWFEGYSLGDPSQSNSIESTHKHMKVTQQKARQPMIRFLHSQLKENGIVHE